MREYFDIAAYPMSSINVASTFAYAGYTNNHYRTGRDMWDEEESDLGRGLRWRNVHTGLTLPHRDRHRDWCGMMLVAVSRRCRRS